MANYLQDLASGLRNAAGVLNPDVQKQTFAADERSLADERETAKMQQQFALTQMTPQAQMARQQLQNEIGFRKEISALGTEPDPGAIASAAMKWGKPEVAANLYRAAEDRAGRLQSSRDALETRKLMLTQAHDANLQRMTDARERAAETARHNRAVEALTAQGRDIQAQLAQAKIDSSGTGKPLPPKLMSDFVEKGQILDSSERFTSNFKDDYAGYASDAIGNLALQAERKNPFSQSTARTQWWQDYELHQSVIRNKLFGSALTAPEIAAWERSAVSPGMNAANVRANLARREVIERTGITRLAKSAATQYNPKAIEEAIGRSMGDVDGKPAAPTTPAPPAGFKLD